MIITNASCFGSYSKKFVCKIEMRETHKIRDNVCDLGETVEQVFAFYKTVYGSDVVMEEEKIILTDNYGEISFAFCV